MKNEIRRVGDEDRRAFMVFIGLPIEVFTRHDVNYGQVWYPTLVDKLINFTKAEPLFGT